MVRQQIDAGLKDLEELLAPFARDSEPRYINADWLLSPSGADVWKTRFNSSSTINWRLPLPDGTYLTDAKHARLLSSLKAWLLARFHVDFTGGRRYGKRPARNIAASNLHCVDYLLLRADNLGILNHGLTVLSENDLKAMVSELSSSAHVAVSVYAWPRRLAAHLRAVTRDISEADLTQARSISVSFDANFPDVASRLTDLSDDEIVKARAWILTRGYYLERLHGARYSPSVRMLSQAIYQGTLQGQSTLFSVPPELCVGVHSRPDAELPRVPVTNGDPSRAQRGQLSRHVRNISVLALLNSEGFDAPLFSPDRLRAFATTLHTKDKGRYKTLPQRIVFMGLRRALELSMSSGDAIVDSYLNIAQAAHASGDSAVSFLDRVDIAPFLVPQCRRMGVSRWSISLSGSGRARGDSPGKNADWYRALRTNTGLYELLQVLYGAVFLVVGTLMARRVGELTDLPAKNYLDKSKTRLVFENRKSGFDDLRETEARPIPPIGVRLLQLLERLQDGLIEIGAMSTHGLLFATPLRQGRVGVCERCSISYSRPLDLFCDWADMPVDQEGRRYYVRQHQLRRFFAMLFFWGGGFGGLDTLRWFLGHTDPAHLWHYITESTPGEALRSVAAEWAAQAVASGAPEFAELASLVQTNFGTRNVSVIDSEALTAHLEDLLAEGVVRIEPQFLDGGSRYRIAVLISNRGGTS